MKKVIRIGSKRKPKVASEEMALTSNLKSKVELIQALIPIGLSAVAEELKQEVEQLAGIKHSRQGGLPGWSSSSSGSGPCNHPLIEAKKAKPLSPPKQIK
jgi:hypothetical protein